MLKVGDKIQFPHAGQIMSTKLNLRTSDIYLVLKIEDKIIKIQETVYGTTHWICKENLEILSYVKRGIDYDY